MSWLHVMPFVVVGFSLAAMFLIGWGSLWLVNRATKTDVHWIEVRVVGTKEAEKALRRLSEEADRLAESLEWTKEAQ